MNKTWAFAVYCAVAAIFLMQLTELLYAIGWTLWQFTAEAAVGIFLIGFVSYLAFGLRD